MDLKFGGSTFFGGASSVAADTLIEINFQHQFLDQSTVAIDADNVTCNTLGGLGAVHLAISLSPVPNYDLCL